MRRLPTFICGVVTGGLLIYAALNFHLLHTQDGLHLIPKVDATLAATYVDVRSFTPADWAQHPDLAMALMRADRGDLLQAAAGQSAWNGVDQLLAPSHPSLPSQ